MQGTGEKQISYQLCPILIFPLQVQAYPEVQASFRNGRMVVAIDKNVILMDNDGEGSCELLSYDNNMWEAGGHQSSHSTNSSLPSSDCIGTVNGGQVVICGLVDGHVHGLLINGIPVFDLWVTIIGSSDAQNLTN